MKADIILKCFSDLSSDCFYDLASYKGIIMYKLP